MSEFPSLKGKEGRVNIGYTDKGQPIYAKVYRKSIVCEVCIDKQELMSFVNKGIELANKHVNELKNIGDVRYWTGFGHALQDIKEEFERSGL